MDPLLPSAHLGIQMSLLAKKVGFKAKKMTTKISYKIRNPRKFSKLYHFFLTPSLMLQDKDENGAEQRSSFRHLGLDAEVV